MHEKTGQILRLSSVFRSIDSDKIPSAAHRSIQSEVKSDHEIKAIITELQMEGGRPLDEKGEVRVRNLY